MVPMRSESGTAARSRLYRLWGESSFTWLHLLAVALALAVSALSWPGFMSYDSVLALSQARHGITESGYPPMVSYVWWLMDRIIPGPGGMFLLQNLLVFLGLSKIAAEVRAPRPIAAAALLLVAVSPITLGPMLVVWKDVAFAGWLALAAGFALAYARRHERRDLFLSLVLTAIASSYRLNALPAAVPILAMLGGGMARVRWGEGHWLLRVGGTIVATGVWSIAMIALVYGLSSYRLPDGQRLTPPHGHHPWTMVSDLVGISICTGTSVLPAVLYPAGHVADVGFLRRVYAPQHVQMMFATKVDGVSLAAERIDQVPGLQSHWWHAVLAQPACFLWHRWNVSVYLLGLNSGQAFYLTDSGVAPNDMGLQAHTTRLTRFVIAWLHWDGDGLLARVWCFLLAAVAALGWGLATRREWRPVLMFLASGVAYLAIGALILPAADARYQFWVVLACLATILSVSGEARVRDAVA